MISGVIPVLYSFYGRSGALDLDAHRQQIDWVMGQQADGVTLLGLASEGASLTQAERKAVIAQTARHLSANATLLVTTRSDDDLRAFARTALEFRNEVGLIVQIGQDPAPSIRQIQDIAEETAFASSVKIGLQLAPGLIDTEFSASSLRHLPQTLRRLDFLKAEYNSIELGSHLVSLGKPLALLVGRHGQNLIDYLRIGCVGVIPGTEMTAPLGHILRGWANGQRADAIRRYGIVAPYIDFAMQDLDTVIDVGRAVAARALNLEPGVRRSPSGRDETMFEKAMAFWFSFWREHALDRR